MAAGVLPMCIGRATRAAEYLEADRKRYRCELLLGASSDTGDIWGRVSCEGRGTAGRITMKQVEDAILSMKGVQQQYPPMYSAIRKDGKHLYEYARDGIEVDVEPREITVYEARPVYIFHEPQRVLFDIECSKGTYIRTVCEEIGKKLGCGAVMTFLSRTKSGGFLIEKSVTLEEIIAHIQTEESKSYDEVINPGRKPPELDADMSPFIAPISSMLSGFGCVEAGPSELKKYVNGGKISLRNVSVQKQNSRSSDDRFSDLYCVFGNDGVFAGTAKFDRQKKIFAAGKVFYRG